MRTTVFLVLLAALPAFASEPGQPLDCSDWVFVEPGYSCTSWIPWPCYPNENPFCGSVGGNERVLDNQGRLFRVQKVTSRVDPLCGAIDRTELSYTDGNTRHVLAYLEERCSSPSNGKDAAQPSDLGSKLFFDAPSGRMLIPLSSFCTGSGLCQYSSGDWVPAIVGFSSTFDILQTFTPSPETFSLRVPYMPEGFQFADYFDTYYGDLATVGDWTQAQPLQCGYPASPPSVGDYFEVEDPLPNPDPGKGTYYFTAVHYQGETRYGRKSMGGVVSGRDPAVLPGCGNRSP